MLRDHHRGDVCGELQEDVLDCSGSAGGCADGDDGASVQAATLAVDRWRGAGAWRRVAPCEAERRRRREFEPRGSVSSRRLNRVLRVLR